MGVKCYPDEVARRIGRHIAALVEDGSTIQMGIGTIPDSVLLELMGYRALGGAHAVSPASLRMSWWKTPA